MIDRQQEHEMMIDQQRRFLVKCALLKKSPDEIDLMVKQIEKIRRNVIMR